jgi:putative spermidine/putrescine transport system ATP-binding protein
MRENGATIPADAADGLAAGESVLVSVRPERMRLLDPGDEAEAELAAVVDHAIYVGDHVRLVARPAGLSSDVVVKIVNESGLPPPAPGTTVRLGWRAGDGRALKP